jgi:hypothetical protein
MKRRTMVPTKARQAYRRAGQVAGIGLIFTLACGVPLVSEQLGTSVGDFGKKLSAIFACAAVGICGLAAAWQVGLGNRFSTESREYEVGNDWQTSYIGGFGRPDLPWP